MTATGVDGDPILPVTRRLNWGTHGPFKQVAGMPVIPAFAGGDTEEESFRAHLSLLLASI